MTGFSQAQIVVRDAETGQLPAPVAATTKSTTKSPAAAVGGVRVAPVAQPRVGMITGTINPQPVLHADGSVEQELDASTLSYTVAKRNEDGSISMICVTGKEEAAKALAAKPARSASRLKQEHSHDTK